MRSVQSFSSLSSWASSQLSERFGGVYWQLVLRTITMFTILLLFLFLNRYPGLGSGRGKDRDKGRGESMDGWFRMKSKKANILLGRNLWR